MGSAMSRQPPGSLAFSPLNNLRFIRDPDAFFRRGLARHGDPFRARVPTGNVVVTATPEGAREVFTADPDTFEPQSQLLLEPVVGAASLLLLGGERHKRERRLLMPPFHGERMRAYGALMQECTRRLLEGRAPESVLVAQQLTQAVSLEIIIRAVFGVQEPERVRRYQEVLLDYLNSYTPPIALVKGLRRSFGGRGPWARFQRHVTRLDALLTEELALRRASAGEPRADILSLLLSARDEAGQPMTDDEVKDELRTMLVAGHETTAIGMAWALYHLHRTPEALRRLEEELAPLGPSPEPEALARLPWLSAVCDESLRLHPVVHLVTRRVRKPFTLRGYELPVGMGLMVAIIRIHADPALYPEPERFRPERFLERKFSPFEYLPFGGGARRCIGAAFAQYEMKVVLGTLLAAHRFAATSDAPIRPVRRNVTMAPGRDVELRYLGRVDAPEARREAGVA